MKPTKLALNLKYLRLMHGFTQEFVGSLLSKDHSLISYYESGKRRPNMLTIRQLAHIYNTTVDDLLDKDLTKEQ